MQVEITDRLLTWYGANARALPWRGISNPYATWISEIMLQQTRVETVMPYFLRWMERFPTLSSLAQAEEEEVLRLWEGLGYYSRARNLHRASRMVMHQYDGIFPRDRQLLEKLPGIGRYTAGAITSIAFGMDEAVLDGNIRRVLARIFDIDLQLGTKEADQLFWELAERLLPEGNAGDYNQALMDLGATICTPRSPACEGCPIHDLCKAKALNLQDQRPVKKPKAPVPHHTVTAAVILEEDRFLIARRPPDGLLGGMWEFPGGKQEAGETLSECLQREIIEELGMQIGVGEPFGIYQHAYTHFRVTLHAFLCRIVKGRPQALQASALYWAKPGELDEFAMGKIDRQISNNIQKLFA